MGDILSPSLQVAMSHEQIPQTPPLSWISPETGIRDVEFDQFDLAVAGVADGLG